MGFSENLSYWSFTFAKRTLRFSPGSCWAFWQLSAVLKLDISSVCGQTCLVFFWNWWCYNHQNRLSKESLSLLRGLNYNSVAFRCLKCLTVKNHSHFQNRWIIFSRASMARQSGACWSQIECEISEYIFCRRICQCLAHLKAWYS